MLTLETLSAVVVAMSSAVMTAHYVTHAMQLLFK